MFELPVHAEQIKYATELVNNNNFGQRGHADGTKEMQRIGLIGETVIADLLGQPRPRGTGNDGGHDVIINNSLVDVKTMGRTVPMRSDFVHNFFEVQVRNVCDVLLFCSFNRNNDTLTVCGWLDKADLKRLGTYHRAGDERRRSDGSTFTLRSGLWEVPQSALEPLHEARDMREYIP